MIGAVGLALLAILAAIPGAFSADRTPAQTPESVPAEPIAEGRRVFEEKSCASCHPVWGNGGSPAAGPDLGKVTESWTDVMRLAGTLWNHLPAMTAAMRVRGVERANFSPEEMAKLMTYLFYVKFVGLPGSVERGRQVFKDGHCSDCHQFAGRGGRVAPRLDELKQFASPFFFARALWNHGPEMAEKMKELHVKRTRFKGEDIADLVAYIRGDATRPVELEMVYMQSATPRAGAVLFARRGCVTCHGDDASGGTAPGLNQPGLAMTASDVAAAFWNHGAPMWGKMKEMGLPFPTFGDGEMSDLLAYLAFLQYAGREGDAANGARLFKEKSCAECHAVAGTGAKAATDLVKPHVTASVVQWTTEMWNHEVAMEEKFKEMERPWPRFEGDEMRDLVAFLRATGKPAEATK